MTDCLLTRGDCLSVWEVFVRQCRYHCMWSLTVSLHAGIQRGGRGDTRTWLVPLRLHFISPLELVPLATPALQLSNSGHRSCLWSSDFFFVENSTCYSLFWTSSVDVSSLKVTECTMYKKTRHSKRYRGDGRGVYTLHIISKCFPFYLATEKKFTKLLLNVDESTA